MTIGISTAMRNSRLQLILDAMDAGGGAATLKFYTGPRPATGAAITTETLLATLTCSDPVGTITTGVLTFDAVTEDSSADDTGTVAWARVDDSTTTFVCDLSVTVIAGGGDIEINTTGIVAGSPVSIVSAVITEGNA